jgi:hypothetical protein
VSGAKGRRGSEREKKNEEKKGTETFRNTLPLEEEEEEEDVAEAVSEAAEAARRALSLASLASLVQVEGQDGSGAMSKGKSLESSPIAASTTFQVVSERKGERARNWK